MGGKTFKQEVRLCIGHGSITSSIIVYIFHEYVMVFYWSDKKKQNKKQVASVLN